MKTTYLTFNTIKIYIEENDKDEIVSIGRIFTDIHNYPDSPYLTQNALEISKYLNKDIHSFDLQLKVQGTPFQTQVWDTLKTIPYGQLWTYKMVAKAMGDQNKVRAVANAIAKNKHMIVVPCHRVIGSDGKMHGFAGGIDLKEALIKLERSE